MGHLPLTGDRPSILRQFLENTDLLFDLTFDVLAVRSEMKICLFLVFLTTENLLSESQDPTKVVTAVGSSVKFNGPNISPKVRLSAWVFFNHKSAEIVEFLIERRTSAKANPAYQNRILFYSSLQTLVLLDVQEADSGDYKLIDRDHNTILLHEVLDVFSPIVFPRISSNSTYINSVVALTCSVPVKVESISWLALGKSILDDRYRLIDNNRTLIIDTAQESDSGTYTCLVKNPLGEANNSYQLNLEFPITGGLSRPGLIISVVFGIVFAVPLTLVVGYVLVRYRCHVPPAVTRIHQ
ncbi:carcinoembryonic antigen-related cell adhesion molecule 1-like [Scyliorhinus canicula]|uniref:carcinoembryonic antigen-related cell adhesion molecule 1-like n=1 Tax=Scyliorhinus canicula TaxID=7830 RepID=UPI0018F30C6B|nr:carcinoembryonic antigen-related cell adhesion molecule 1-like [Scyliorhinus canicula]XP_038671581.1 carcinoembryonic antigen-related cell adhesion molecule 1-like [Scyliorhinus canicula]